MPFDSSASDLRVCVVGQHEFSYPRNVVNQRLIRAAGYAITLCHSRAPVPFRTWSIIVQYLRAAKSVQVIFATEGSHRHIPWLKLVTLWSARSIVFDPFISLYNTEVEDRRLYRPGSLGARAAELRDLMACRCADLLVFDTVEHKEYFYARYRLDKPYCILRLGVDEAVFQPRLPQRTTSAATNVLFYGTFIPLQGIHVIVRAAALLRDDSTIKFSLIGTGQEYARIRALADPMRLPNLSFVPPMTPEQLATRIADADICLGVFDSGVKAAQVVPNKVVQCAAMQKPVITRRSPAIEREFEPGSLMLVPPDDHVSLAESITTLARDPARGAALAAKARQAFVERFSLRAQTASMRRLLDRAAQQSTTSRGAALDLPPLPLQPRSEK